MRKKYRCFIMLALMLICGAQAMAATKEPDATWEWLLKQVKSGNKIITLPSNIICEGDEGLLAEEPITIEGDGFSLKGALVDGGQVTFHNTRLQGIHGLADESGGAALTVRGDETVVIFTGHTDAIGGRSGPTGEYGGDGVRLEGNRQGLILRGKSTSTGGIGYFNGGAGVRIIGCENTVLATDSAACIGKPGLGVGGAGVDGPSCATVGFSGRTASAGGGSAYTGGSGILSVPCTVCQVHGNMKVLDQAIITSGVGAAGGHAIEILRESFDSTKKDLPVDLRLEGEITLVGGHGGTAGSAIHAVSGILRYMDTPTFYSGNYLEKEAPILDLTDCIEDGSKEGIIAEQGKQLGTEAYPAKDMSAIISAELKQTNDRYTPSVVTDGLTKRELATKYHELSVVKGKTGKAAVNGISMKMNLWNGTYEKRLDFYQWLASDGKDGVRYVMVATKPEEWLAVEGTVEAFEKLLSLGITQLAYTSVDPVYCERIIDLAAMLEAVKAAEMPVERVLFGTADDCVIFVFEGDKQWVYQEELMDKLRVELEALPAEDAEDTAV